MIILIKDYIDRSTKTALQRAVHKDFVDIVHYFYKECNQDISKFEQVSIYFCALDILNV